MENKIKVECPNCGEINFTFDPAVREWLAVDWCSFCYYPFRAGDLNQNVPLAAKVENDKLVVDEGKRLLVELEDEEVGK